MVAMLSTKAGTLGTGALSTKPGSAGGAGMAALVVVVDATSSPPPLAARTIALDNAATCSGKRLRDANMQGSILSVEDGGLSWAIVTQPLRICFGARSMRPNSHYLVNS
ncbi:hypothetical protein BDI4_690007 [Burkholderia diffusa]|nr:hypothetical protein BDI4_690007 [Burkholderia diffusa]